MNSFIDFYVANGTLEDVAGELQKMLLASKSVGELIKLFIRLYTAEADKTSSEVTAVYVNLNAMLRTVPIDFARTFLNDASPTVTYACLLQRSIEALSTLTPIGECTLWRGMKCGAKDYAPLYQSHIGKTIVWMHFTSTTTNRQVAIRNFALRRGYIDPILFEITHGRDDTAVSVKQWSKYPREEEVLLPAESAFVVIAIEELTVKGITMPVVRLRQCSWEEDLKSEERTPDNLVLWKKMAEEGDRKAAYMIGKFLMDGSPDEGIEKNPVESVKYFKMSAEAKFPLGMYEYGVSLLVGRGVTPDNEAAIQWLHDAAVAGVSEARMLLSPGYLEFK